MNKFSINDWLTIQTRKDLTFIRRSLERESVDYAIFADLFIAVFSFVLDHVFWTTSDPDTGAITRVAPSWYWIVTAVLLVIVPAFIFAVGFFKRRRYQSDDKKVMPAELLVDLFDNEICYNVMTADSMRDHMLSTNEELEDEIRKFYFIEAAYYANKASFQLCFFKIQGKNAIKNLSTDKAVSIVRFRNVCDIISKIYKELIEYAGNNKVYTPLLEDCRDKVFNFNSLLNHLQKNHVLDGLSDFIIAFPEGKTDTSTQIISSSQDATELP